MSALHFRPRGFSELIDATFQIVRARFRVLATCSALIMIPLMAVSLLYALITPQIDLSGTAGENGTVATTTAIPDPPAWLWLLLLPLVVVSVWTFVVGFAALVQVAVRAYHGEALDVGPAIAHARDHFWTLFRTSILKWLSVFALFIGGAMLVALGGAISPIIGVLGMIGMIVAALGVFIMWSVTTPVVLTEGGSARGALDRSAALTKGARLRLTGVYAVMVVVFYALMGMIMFVGMFVLRSMILGQVLGNLASLVMYPVFATLVAVVYYDLRIRNEGLDLELMAAGLGSEATLPAPAAGARQPA
jgi:hypothetical protein